MFRRSPDDIGSMSNATIGRRGLIVAQQMLGMGWARCSLAFGCRLNDGAFHPLASGGGDLVLPPLPVGLIDHLVPKSEPDATWMRLPFYGVRVGLFVVSGNRQLPEYGDVVSGVRYTACPVDGTHPLEPVELAGVMRFEPDADVAILRAALEAMAKCWLLRTVYRYEMSRPLPNF